MDSILWLALMESQGLGCIKVSGFIGWQLISLTAYGLPIRVEILTDITYRAIGVINPASIKKQLDSDLCSSLDSCQSYCCNVIYLLLESEFWGTLHCGVRMVVSDSLVPRLGIETGLILGLCPANERRQYFALWFEYGICQIDIHIWSEQQQS